MTDAEEKGFGPGIVIARHIIQAEVNAHDKRCHGGDRPKSCDSRQALIAAMMHLIGLGMEDVPKILQVLEYCKDEYPGTGQAPGPTEGP